MSANKTEVKAGGGWLLVVVLVALVGLWVVRRSSRAPAAPEASNAATQDVATAAAPVESPYRRMMGQWSRTDGDYTLDLKWVGADGRVEAVYLNPQPIHVSRAEVSEADTRIKLLVELQDTGYPGCVYTLYFDPEQDLLSGQYYQAAMQETFDVAFTRGQ